MSIKINRINGVNGTSTSPSSGRFFYALQVDTGRYPATAKRPRMTKTCSHILLKMIIICFAFWEPTHTCTNNKEDLIPFINMQSIIIKWNKIPQYLLDDPRGTTYHRLRVLTKSTKKFLSILAWRLLILLAGDIELNPGPKYPCLLCNKSVTKSWCIQCAGCLKYIDRKCTKLSIEELKSSAYKWYCSSVKPDGCIKDHPKSPHKTKPKPKKPTTISKNIPNTQDTRAKCKNVLMYDDYKIEMNKYKDNLKITHLNAQSLNLKKTNFAKIIKESSLNTITAVNETWLETHDKDDDWIIDKENIDLFRIDRDKIQTNKSKGGGSLILCPKNLKPKRRKDLEINLSNIENIWIEISVSQRKILINLIYNPCKNGLNELSDFLEKNIDLAITENKNIIAIGDYNLNILNPASKRKIEDILLPYGLQINNTQTPTRIQGASSSIIDLCISDLNHMKSIVTDPPMNTDHLMTTNICPIKITRHNKARQITTLDKTNYQKELFIDDLKKQNFGHIYASSCANEAYNLFEKTFGSVLHRHAPVTRKFIRTKKEINLPRNNQLIKDLSTEKKNAIKTTAKTHLKFLFPVTKKPGTSITTPSRQ